MTNRTELCVEHDFDQPAADVVAAFFGLYDDPEQEWIVESDLDLRVGGHWELVFHPPGLPQFREHRTFIEVDLPNRLTYATTIVGDTATFDTWVTMVLEPHGAGGSRLTLRQAGFPDPPTCDQFATAWPSVLDLVGERVSA
jgi:uncharacterized protein YndB with AHSA1/START domain